MVDTCFGLAVVGGLYCTAADEKVHSVFAAQN